MSQTDPVASRPTTVGHAVSALLYLALILLAYRSILSAPATLLPMPAEMTGQKTAMLYQGDQRFVVGAIAIAAHKVLSAPSEIAGYGLCYPLRASYTLGEHMFGEILLALPVYAVTGDPILSYNAMVILTLWLAALAMYALALHWTESVPAAFVAGLLFALHPAKVSNPAHPFVHGNLWTPLALLFAHRLFVHRRWRDALLLALFICLQLLESFYQVLGLALIGGVYGAFLIARDPRALPRLLPKLLVVAAIAATVTWLVFGPYLETREVWGVLQGRPKTLLFWPQEYLPGWGASVGLMSLLLAVAGILDRLRGPRRVDGVDPRLAMIAAGALVFWCTSVPLPLPLIDIVVESPLVSLAGWVPGLDAVRVLRALRFGLYLVLSFLGAYGVLLLTDRLRGTARSLAIATIAACVLIETFAPSGVLTTGRRAIALQSYRGLPQAEAIQLAHKVRPGAVLDLPLSFDATGKLAHMPHYVMLAAYHLQPAAACYNSFRTPLQYDLAQLAKRLPDPAAADALYALGFRSLVLHTKLLGPAGMEALAPLLEDESRTGVRHDEGGILLYELRSPHRVTKAFEALAAAPAAAPTAGDQAPAPLAPPTSPVEVSFANRGEAIFRDPTLEPTDLVVRWRDAAGAVVATSSARTLLPMSLAPGDTTTKRIDVTVPAAAGPGAYTIELAPAGWPELVLARRAVVVAQPRAGAASSPASDASAASSSTAGLVSP